jgi:hypothetical protein
MNQQKDDLICLSERRHGPQVDEIHIDFLLWEEFESNEEFLRGFVRLCAVGDPVLERIGQVRRSVADSSGESDLVVVYRAVSGKRIGMLVEDKVGAALQPQQAERYRMRGKRGLQTQWDDFFTCLVAPQAYIDRVQDFDAAVSLEEVARLFDGSAGAARELFKQRIIRDAIEKERLSGPQNVDPNVTEFRRRYYELLQQESPDLKMNPPQPAYAGETWFKLKHDYLAGTAYIHHKADRGFVDLCFPGVAAVQLSPLADLLREHGWQIRQTGKSTSIRALVPRITNFASFATELSGVRQALAAAMLLCAFFAQQRSSILGALA